MIKLVRWLFRAREDTREMARQQELDRRVEQVLSDHKKIQRKKNKALAEYHRIERQFATTGKPNQL